MTRIRATASFAHCAVVLGLTLLLLPAFLFAQETRGRITGRVLDPSKGVVSGATVKVTDVARATTANATTNAEGLFQVNYLLPGTYQVTVEFAGFKKYVRDNVQVQFNETIDVPVTLEVGPQEEMITVSAERLAMNTSDANLGFTVDQKRLQDLPLIHGDPYKIMGLAAGVSYTGSARLDRPYEPTHIVGYAYDGTRGNRSDLLIDGLPSTSTANQNEVIASYVPPSDLVQEFRVQTATFDAQFGNTEGGVTSIAIKSGTNALHGSVYYFFEPVGLSANDFFGKARGQDRIDSSSTRPGFTLNGPVNIPGLYNGKEKTFFTVGFERIKDTRPRFDAGQDVWVPTEALRNGDFSGYDTIIYDPLTRVETSPGSGQYVGQPFPGNIIPDNRISPVAKAMLGYYRLPKGSGLKGNIYDSNLPETANYNTATFRLDQKISDRNRAFVRGSWYKRDSHYNDYMGNGLTSTNFQFISYQAVLDDVHMFNPTTVLNVRYGFNRFERNSGQEAEYVKDFDLASLGFASEYNTLVPAANRGFPRLEFPANTMIGTAFGNDFRPTTSHTVAATLNKSLARHSLKAGIEMRIYREDSLPTGNARAGRYVFNNNYTREKSASGADPDGLGAYASFLLGLPSTLEMQRLADYSEYSKTWGFFVHDDWRVNDKLTLNIGLRYEIEAPLVERNGKSVSGFDTSYVQPIAAQAQAKYAALNDPALKAFVPDLNVRGGLMFENVDTGKGLYKAPKDGLLPRFGFAYQLNDKTVVRGGAGLFAGFLGQRRGDVITNGWSQTTTLGATKTASGAPIPRDWSNAFVTNAILEPVGNANGRQQGIGQNISFFNQDPKVSKQLRWQIGFQRELPLGFLVEAAYVGNYGYNIEIVYDMNALPNQYLNGDNSRTKAMNDNNSFLTTQVANPFEKLLPGSGFNSSKIARSQLLRPYPAFGNITATNNDGKSWYHSFQGSLQKRLTHGFTLGAAYTYSHWMQATEYLNAGDKTPTKMVSDLDAPHRLSLSGIFEFPFGKGKRFLSDATGALDVLASGWQLQGTYNYQTGFPTQFGTFNIATGAVSGDIFYNGGVISVSNPSTQKWFNANAFTSTIGGASKDNASPVNHLRTTPFRFEDVRGDSISTADLALTKDVRLKNDMRLQMRAEFINAFNHPLFPQPITNQTSDTFGKVTASNVNNYARRAQIAVKLIF